MHPHKTTNRDVSHLIQRAAAGNAAFMNGDMTRWLDLLPLAQDFSIMTPFGGWTAKGFDASPERLAAMAKTFTSATTDLDVIATYATPDMVVLAIVERQHAIVGGLPAQDWSLRVTLVFRRDDAEWRLVHRHADPLVQGITLDRLSELARGGVDDAAIRA
jgi:ketosteroid isomerase-like protein